MRFDVITAVTLKITVFRHVASCSQADVIQVRRNMLPPRSGRSFFSVLKTKAPCFSKIFINIYPAIRRDIQEDFNMYVTDVLVSQVRLFWYLGYYSVSIILLGDM